MGVNFRSVFTVGSPRRSTGGSAKPIRRSDRVEGDQVPELPEGFRVDFDDQGWRHCLRETGWHRPFDDEIVLPDGRVLKTLGDAGSYVAALPDKVQHRPEWRNGGLPPRC